MLVHSADTRRQATTLNGTASESAVTWTALRTNGTTAAAVVPQSTAARIALAAIVAGKASDRIRARKDDGAA